MYFRSDSFYGEQSGQYHFYRISHQLNLGEEFRRLSTEAKPLYGMMLDYIKLSAKNSWYDDLVRIFTYYTMEEIKAHLNCSHDKALKMLGKLDTTKGICLIERIRQGPLPKVSEKVDKGPQNQEKQLHRPLPPI